MTTLTLRKSLKYTGVGLGVLLAGRIVYNAVRKDGDSNVTVGKDAGKSRDNASPLNDKTLKNVQVFFRHGARTPLRHIPLDDVIWDKDVLLAKPPHTVFDYTVVSLDGGPPPESALEKRYKKVKFQGGCHAGQLTWLGQEQAYNLGLKLRQDYMKDSKLLSENYDPKDVYMRSTNINRTLHSLRCVMAGLFGAEHLQQKKNIQVPVAGGEREELYPNRFCDCFDTYFQIALKGGVPIPGLADFCSSLARFINYEDKGQKKMLDMIDWRDNMAARQAHNLHIPDRLKEWIPMMDFHATQVANVIFCGPLDNSKLMVPFTAGRLMKGVQDNIHNAAQGSSRSHKLYLYSCHDSTLITILEALSINDRKWPPFTADIRFELYEGKPKEFWVRILYCGKEAIPEGKSSAVMTLKEFDDFISPYAMSQEIWSMRCKEDTAHEHSSKRKLLGPVGDEEENGNSVLSNK